MAFQDLIARAGNEALQINPTVATIDITVKASDWLWFIFSVMGLTTIGVGFWAHLGVPHGQRTFHHLSMMITGTASIAYFCMASDLGATPVEIEFVRAPYMERVTRSIWYARYIDWTITTPLLLLELLMVTGLPLSDIVVTIFFDIVMIITGLIGALVPSDYKWGLFTFGCAAMLYVFYMLYFPGRKASKTLGSELSKSYMTGAAMLTFLWFLYPIAWGLADGGNVISPNGEMYFYGALDLFAKPVFAIVHLFSLRKVDYASLKLNSGKFSEFADPEKSVASHPMTTKTAENNGAASPAAGESTVHGH